MTRLKRGETTERGLLLSSPPSNQKKIDVAKALKLRLQGNTFEEIASIFDVSRSAVYQALNSFESVLKDVQPGQLTAYSEQRREIFQLAEARLLRSCLDEHAIEKAPLAARVMAFGTIYDKGRLESGKSTENLGILGKIVLEAEGELSKPAKEKKIE